MKLAIFPGGFKPPHIGHYLAAKYLAKRANRVIVRIGSLERGGINAATSLILWNYYISADNDPLAQKIIPSISKFNTPITDIYKFIEMVIPKGSELLLGVSEKDKNDTRFSGPQIQELADRKNIKLIKTIIPMMGDSISSSELRKLISSDNKEETFKYLPSFLPLEIKEEIWEVLVDTTLPSDIDETMMGTMNKQEMAKHNANMKKLRRWINKQGDQMVPYPRKYSSALSRKLYESFNKDAWTQLLTEGGVAGHIPHPFELNTIFNGEQLLNLFKSIPQSIGEGNGTLKLDGINTSVKLVDTPEGKEFALDRGSNRDLQGITVDKLNNRFKPGHPMINIGRIILEIFNNIKSQESLLKKIGLWDTPNHIINVEYINGKTNRIDYKDKIIAIHGIIDRKSPNSSLSTIYNKTLTKLLTPYAQAKGYTIYSEIPTRIQSPPSFEKMLNQKYSIKYPNSTETKLVSEWISYIDEIPKSNTITLTDGSKNKALSKKTYNIIIKDKNPSLISEDDFEVALKGALTYLFTEMLGNIILTSSISPLGSLSDHEGIVINDDAISSSIFKITGKFISPN